MKLQRPRRQPPTTETAGRVVITYQRGGPNVPNGIAWVRRRDYERLVNVINAYHELVRLHAEQKPYDDVRQNAFNLIALMFDTTPERVQRQTIQHYPFELETYTFEPGRRDRPGRLRARRVYVLSPWTMESAEFVQTTTVVALPQEQS